MPESLLNISVTAPLTPAFERMKRILFQPFDLSVWLTIGLCAWLAQLGHFSGGGGGGGAGFRGGGRGGAPLEEAMQGARDYILSNLYWIIPAAVGIGLAVLGIWLVLTWLGSRGEFMLLHCVGERKAEVTVPWTLYAQHSTSLFLFRIVVGLIAICLLLPLAVLGIWTLDRLVSGESRTFASGLTMALTVLVAIVVGVAFALTEKLTRDFVVPIMYLYTTSCVVAWRRFLLLATRNVSKFVLYILFSVVLAVLIGFLIFAVVILTCCCAGCLMSIPYVGTVLLLPVYLFQRAYSAEYLAQYGPELSVFRWTL